MTTDQLKNYARWLCIHNQAASRNFWRREFRATQGDDLADKLETIYKAKLTEWNEKTPVEQNAITQNDRMALLGKLHGDKAA